MVQRVAVIVSFTLFFALFFSFGASATTFVVTNLNDPGAGSLREAIDNSNLSPGPDKIVFSEGLIGTIVPNLGDYFIGDDVEIIGPGPDKITIDADDKSGIFFISDGIDETSKIIKISGLRLINGTRVGHGGIIANFENLTVENCEFIHGDSTIVSGGAIDNTRLLTIKSCLFENNRALSDQGGAIFNESLGIILAIEDSEFRNNKAAYGGAIQNNGSTINHIRNTLFSGNTSTGSAGAIRNEQGTIKEISNCTFYNNSNSGVDSGGAIANNLGLIEKIINCTFGHNSSDYGGGAISDGGVTNISFTTFADNQAGTGGAIEGGSSTRIRNSILAFNTPDNCIGTISDFGGNYSNDSSCGFFGDNSEIILGPLMDNGGPTETMALLGGDPENGATVNCDALDDMGNPTGIPVGIDQRYFPRPFGARCDSGAFEAQPTASVTITKVTDPTGGAGFGFESDGFGVLEGCGLRGDGGDFIMNDGDSISCIVPQGDFSIKENTPNGYALSIICTEAPEDIVINNKTGEIDFTLVNPDTNVDCVYTNVRTGNGGGCSIAPSGANDSLPLYLFIPALIVIRKIFKKCRN